MPQSDGSRPGIVELPAQHTQRGCIVDIVPLRQNLDLKADLGRARKRLGRGLIRAPGNILEQSPVRRFEAEQIVAAVARRAEDRAIARTRQPLRGCRPGATLVTWGCRS